MGHKTTIGGTAYEVKGGKTLIGGTGYSIKGGKTLIGGTGYGISFGTPLSSLAVGTSVYLNESGSPVEYLIVHQGLPSNSYDSSCNGTWLLRKDTTATTAYYANGGTTYPFSSATARLNGTFLGTLDKAIQNIIKQVKIPYCNLIHTGNVASGADGFSTKVFLLSGAEMGHTYISLPQEGTALSYFNGASNTIKSANKDGTTTKVKWWLRSVVKDGEGYVWAIVQNGSIDYFQWDESGTYDRPAFILPSETKVDENFNVIA